MNHRKTKQKRILEEELLKLKTFFTAEELLERTNKIDSKIGIATIYRFLKEKSHRAELHSYYCDRKQVYSTQDNNHCHFTCTQCGQITHFSVKDLNFIKKNIEEEVCHFQIDLYGVCKMCQKENKKKIL